MNTFVQRLRTIISERVQEVTDLQQRVVSLEVANSRLRGEPSSISSLTKEGLKLLKGDLTVSYANVTAAIEKDSTSKSSSLPKLPFAKEDGDTTR